MSSQSPPLNGKTILLFCPAAFNYDYEIAAALQRMGATVFYRRDASSFHPWSKVLVRIAPRLAWTHADDVYRRWLSSVGKIHVDEVLIIKSESISPAIIRLLRDRFSKAKFTLYLWDSVQNVRNVEQKFVFFDRLLSFDRQDCKRFPVLRYRPLFFLDRYWVEHPKEGHGVYFIGTLHSDRPRVLRGLAAVLREEQVPLDYWLFVRSRLEFQLRRLVDPAIRELESSRFSFAAMRSEEIARRFSSCTAVLDIQHHHQTGMTMRTFEVLASGKKLITTNPSVQEETFFDPGRICFVNRAQPRLPKGFLASTPPPLGQDFRRRYSIDGWLAELLGLADGHA